MNFFFFFFPQNSKVVLTVCVLGCLFPTMRSRSSSLSQCSRGFWGGFFWIVKMGKKNPLNKQKKMNSMLSCPAVKKSHVQFIFKKKTSVIWQALCFSNLQTQNWWSLSCDISLSGYTDTINKVVGVKQNWTFTYIAQEYIYKYINFFKCKINLNCRFYSWTLLEKW